MTVAADKIELCVGFHSPGLADELHEFELADALRGNRSARALERHPLSTAEFDWGPFVPRRGAEPSRVAQNTSEAAAAIVPGINFSQNLPAAFARFLSGAHERDERALVLCAMGRDESGAPWLEPHELSICVLPGGAGLVRGVALPGRQTETGGRRYIGRA